MWNFGGVLKRRDPQMCTLGVLGLSAREKERKWRRGGTKKKGEMLGPPPSGPYAAGGPRGLHFFWVWAPAFLNFYHVAHLFFFCAFLIVSISFHFSKKSLFLLFFFEFF